jgi:preprotein translocase subunit SecA
MFVQGNSPLYPPQADGEGPGVGSSLSERGEKGRGGDKSQHQTRRFALGLYVIAVEPGPSRRLDDQLRGRSGRQGDEGVTRLFASLDDETLRFYGDTRVRTRALRAVTGRPFLEGRAAGRVIRDAQRRAERMHAGQRTVLFEFDRVLEAQRRTMLGAYDRVLAHAEPDAAVHGFIPAVAAHELSRSPADPTAWPVWEVDVRRRYGLPPNHEPPAGGSGEGAHPPAPPLTVPALTELLGRRWEKSSIEAREQWPALCRAVLLRTASALWARHVEMIDHIQRQAPITFGFLPTPAVVNFAREASARYQDYLIAVRAETLSTLLTLPMPYERPLPVDVEVRLSMAAMQTLGSDPTPGPSPSAVGG